MAEQFPSFDVFMAQKLGAGARLQTAMTWEDTYLEYIRLYNKGAGFLQKEDGGGLCCAL